ncbi:MAG: FAD-dependent oxidoreductase [Clostridia bacterium]|nr:FAD-dependent oxidoreductase [Clostridia bacterium]
MNSIWSADRDSTRYEPINGTRHTDVLIIGGGMAGILCAHRLTSAGIDCLVAEAGRIANGVTANTTAKITLQHGFIYDKLIRKFGEDTARLYAEAQVMAGEEFARLCRVIPCDYERRDSFVYSRDDRRELEREQFALESVGIEAELIDKVPIPVDTVGAIRVKNQAQFHPLKFALTLAKELQISEGTRVLEIRGDTAITDRGRITFKKVIVATHFPFLNKHGSYFLKMYQHRSYVLALENATLPRGMYVDGAKDGLSFRTYGKHLLLGGGAHRSGASGGGWRPLEEFARNNYPDSHIAFRYATQDCMTLDGIPYIGKYSRRTPSMYVATGFNKWGMTSSMIAAILLCDLIQERDNDLEEIFSPSRSILHPSLLSNVLHSAIGLLTPTVPRCPHLGCALKYNRAEHSWDCPCHGSRFTEDGRSLDGPANGNITRKL